MDYAYWTVFLSAAIALCISPGPDLIYILTKTTAQGAKSGIMASLGISAGAITHVCAAAFGLSAILAASATAFTVIKIIGAIYLFYLGFTAIFSKKENKLSGHKNKKTTTGWATFKQGALIDLFNPKVSIFFMAFLPQFVRPESGSATTQILFLGLLVVLIGLVIEIILLYAVAKTATLFTKGGRFNYVMEKLLGSVFIGLGIRLALSTK